MKKIGFIGLGIMGKHMSKNLLKAGYPLVVYDIVAEAVDEAVKAGAEKGTSPKDVAAKTDAIITMLPNSPHVKEVVLGGGVTANRSLVQALEGVGTEEGFRVLHPSPLLCTDNGVMIAAAAHYLAEEGRIGGLETNARANAPLT